MKLSKFTRETLQDRYIYKNEAPEEIFQRVVDAYGSDKEHANRMLSYIYKEWFMPATPILSNGGTDRGLPISCFLNIVDDSMESIKDTMGENFGLSKGGGGIGTCWSPVRSMEDIKGSGKSGGVIPFMKIQDAQSNAVNQGSLRRGSSAAYLHINHPEIREFINIRRPEGDLNRKCLNLHHGIIIDDKFMTAVESQGTYDLISPKTKKVVETVDAFELWATILECRIEHGEPYLIFIDNVNEDIPEHHKELGLYVNQSNLCSEITLPTNHERTAVCCLGSVNLENFDEWQYNELFIEDCLRFLDNVLEDFIQNTDNPKAKYSAKMERSVGLGAMGFAYYLQRHNISFESRKAGDINTLMFKTIQDNCEKANNKLGKELGICPDFINAKLQVLEGGTMDLYYLRTPRFSNCTAIAPTASISTFCGQTSPCIEPLRANIYTQTTLSGTYLNKNKYLEKLLEEKGKNTDDVWVAILKANGSVQHLNFLSEKEKEVYKTAFEIDQKVIIELGAERQKYIDQAQSINTFIRPDIHKLKAHNTHFRAWELGLKSLYYLRSEAVRAKDVANDNKKEHDKILISVSEECEACQ